MRTFYAMDEHANIFEIQGVLDKADIFDVQRHQKVLLDDVAHYQAKLRGVNGSSNVFIPCDFLNNAD